MSDVENKGYTDTKEFICTGCGKTVMATKFASQKTIKCDDCKKNNVPINPEIVAGALSSSKKLVVSRNPMQSSAPTGETKECPCIKCGTMTTVTKFASAKKVLCDTCKDTGVKASDVEVDDDDYVRTPRILEINVNKIRWDQIKPIEEYRINELFIANKKLQKVSCPACGADGMKILSVADSAQFGLIIRYQCQHCRLVMILDEQTKRLLKPMKSGRRYNYTGDEMEKLADSMDDTRLANSVRYLLKICYDNGIKVDGFEQPQYYFKEEKPVPVGFVMPPEDRFQHILDSIIEGFTKAGREGDIVDEPEGSKYIKVSDTLANKIVRDLKGILKEE